MSLIETSNLYKTYEVGDVQVHALQGVSINIERGEFVAVMGPSGSGKSTFMNILGCLDKPTQGKYVLDGIDVTATDLSELAGVRNRKIGFVFQGFNLISRTSALENVELPMVYNHTPASKRREKAMQALEAVGLAQRAHHMPNQLSGGQQQRVAIARSLVCDAPIIFADEPTGNLDTKMSIEVMELFTRLNKEMGKTIILITHEPDIAEYAGRLITFRDGKKVSDEVKK
ncbi:MAG: ABC transporter ATP-binding protein [Elusimicrobiaceae bacterium]|nr:ABC transporter ATP-binding protein [Elusimicrobiaceae bacterium]MBR3899134.1 ABC transporter ATP-binding protein [Elusimicrobiaceae bacterium]